MAYLALRPFKYQLDDGTMATATVGQEIPEADGWKNLDKYIRRKWVTQANGEPWDGRIYHVPQIAAKGVIRQSVAGAKAAAGVAAPPKGPDAARTDMTTMQPEHRLDMDPTPVAGLIQDKYTEESLNKLYKADLKIIAEKMDLEVEGRKADIVAAILEAQSG